MTTRYAAEVRTENDETNVSERFPPYVGVGRIMDNKIETKNLLGQERSSCDGSSACTPDRSDLCTPDRGDGCACTLRVTSVEGTTAEAPSHMQRQKTCWMRNGGIGEDVPGRHGKHGRGRGQADKGAESECNGSTHVY
jgi:hypothetical protein